MLYMFDNVANLMCSSILSYGKIYIVLVVVIDRLSM